MTTSNDDIDKILADYGIVVSPAEGWHKETIRNFKTALSHLITAKQKEARIDELERLNFKEASGFLRGGTSIVRQQVVTKRIKALRENTNER